jgi:hypothetical protein
MGGVISAQNPWQNIAKLCQPKQDVAVSCIVDDNKRLCKLFPEFAASEGFTIGANAGSVTTNQSIPTNTNLSIVGKNIVVNGIYRITRSVTFKDCNFLMGPGAQISLDMQGSARVKFNACNFFSCTQMWKGITVSSNSSVAFEFTSCHIEDAYQALVLNESPTAFSIISGCKFNNNYIGITNRKKNFTAINAFWSGNTFERTSNLLPMFLGLSGNNISSFHPRVYAGILLEKTTVTIGKSLSGSSDGNVFRCIMHGIIATNSTVSSLNNFFFSLNEDGTGIFITGGSLVSYSDTFADNGFNGIHAEGTRLDISEGTFGGNTQFMIQSNNNNTTRKIKIHDNQFNINHINCYQGIAVERSSELTLSTTYITDIYENTFDITGEAGGLFGFFGISIADNFKLFGSAGVHNNTINVNEAAEKIVGIILYMGPSDNYKILDNNIYFNNSNPDVFKHHGIEIVGFWPNGGKNHEVKNNLILGATHKEYHAFCGIHGGNCDNITFCNNTVNNTNNGLHFFYDNDISLIENNINKHQDGLWIGVAGGDMSNHIGRQIRRKNNWLDEANYEDWAAECNCDFPLLSQFLTITDVLPEFPTPSKIFPAISGTNGIPWFLQENGTAESCGVIPFKKISDYEKMVLDNESNLATEALWEKRKGLYLKFLSEGAVNEIELGAFATQFNAGTIPKFAEIDQRYINAANMGTFELTALQNIDNSIHQLLEQLKSSDNNAVPVEDIELIDAAYLQNRGSLLQQISVLTGEEAILKENSNTIKHTNLKTALELNNAISVSESHEKEQKLINQVKIGYALGEGIEETTLLDLIAIADKSPTEVGMISEQANNLLPLCIRKNTKDGEVKTKSRAEKKTSDDISNLKVSPNPTDGLFEVNIPINFGKGILNVVNSSGVTISTFDIIDTKTSITVDLSKYPSGLYLLTLRSNDNKQFSSTKLILQH